MDHLKSSHAQQLQEVESQVQEKDSRISELLMHLRKLRGEVGSNLNSTDLPPSLSLKPPGSVKRTTSVAVQTSSLPDYTEQGNFEGQGQPAILPLAMGVENHNEPDVVMNGGDSAALKSLGPMEEVRECQLLSHVPRPLPLCLDIRLHIHVGTGCLASRFTGDLSLGFN